MMITMVIHDDDVNDDGGGVDDDGGDADNDQDGDGAEYDCDCLGNDEGDEKCGDDDAKDVIETTSEPEL